MRIELVIERIPCRGTNDLIELLQSCVRGELYKKRLDKLAGMTDRERREHDSVTIARGFRKCHLSRHRVVRADVDSHVRLEHGRSRAPREIVNDALEKTALRLGWNEPKSNNDLSGHKSASSTFAVQ